MKRSYSLVFLLTLLAPILFINDEINAQCNVNEKYDKIISGYHSSIALKDDGSYAVWGSFMQPSGAADQLAPLNINSTNYSGLTGTIYKTALGGKTAGTQVDQAFVLTSTGLWAWGVAGNVVSTGVKSGNAFGRTSIASASGFNTYGLPAAIAPADVANLFATCQTLMLLTTSGNVWILTQTTVAVEANGGTATTAASSTWKQVKINSTTNLTNVTAVRGQVSSNSLNAFMALTSSGQVYTWGNSVYLGDGNASTSKVYATLMTLPSEFSSSVPKLIGITGGMSYSNTTKNTYFLLSSAGNLYSLGDNSQRQCGDFTTVEKLSWVRVKKTSAAGDNLNNINSFSCQEHNSSYPGVAAITTTGTLYTWGNNSSGMVGRTDNNASNGALTTASFDPGIPVGFTGTAIAVEMGGHTMVYLKAGSSQFCYVGHYTNGSMGDGTNGNNGSPAATSLKHDCGSTPVINICGSVPVAGSTINSAISASQSSIQATGSSTSVITVRLKDASGNNLTSSGGVGVVTTSTGALGTVVDNNDGTYTVVLTSSVSISTATLGFSLNGTTASGTTQVQFISSTLPLSWLDVTAYRQDKKVKITWPTAQEINVSHFEIERSFDGANWQTAIAGIPANNLTSTNHYKQTDNDYNAGRVFYRIKQYDIDGHFTYSPVLLIPTDSGTNNAVIYPVPVFSSFQLSNIVPGKLKQIDLYTVNGTIVKSWKTYKSSYDVQDISAGIYIVRIETTDGNVQNLKLNKR